MSDLTSNTLSSNETERVEFGPLEEYRIESLPANAYYIPNFLTPTESSTLLSRISSHPWTTLTHRRLQPHPAPLTASGHLLTSKSLPQWLDTPIVDRLLQLTFENNKGIFTTSPHARPNHVLINEYPPGTGISPHEDGGAYFPVVCTVSLAAHIVLEVTPKRDISSSSSSSSATLPPDEENGSGEEKVYKIYQEPRSLLITMDEMYTSHLHGISAVSADEGLSSTTVANWSLLDDTTKKIIEEENGTVKRETVRISLTYRDVLKVKDAGRLFGGRGFK